MKSRLRIIENGVFVGAVVLAMGTYTAVCVAEFVRLGYFSDWSWQQTAIWFALLVSALLPFGIFLPWPKVR